MIKFIQGDLLEATEDIIVHQVNCRGKMGSGIALQIKEKFPIAYQDYMHVCSNKKNFDLLGSVRITYLAKERKYIAHLFGQDKYGYDGNRYTNYEAIYTGLEYIADITKSTQKSIAIPYKLGCDRGGADWEIVMTMIERLFNEHDVTIYALKL